MTHVFRTLAVAGLVLGLAGCATATSESSGSRAELYESIDQVAADSDLVVVVTSTSTTSSASEPQLMTATDVVVDQSFTPDAEPSDTVTVWQLGSGATPGPLPLMKDGGRYLLFLVETGLPAGGYFITGSSAGFWVADGDSFTRAVDEGDPLPETVTVDDLT